MAKKTLYKCNSCEHTSTKFFGICPKCDGMGEEVEVQNTVIKGTNKNSLSDEFIKINRPIISDILDTDIQRLDTGLHQLNILFGGDNNTYGIAKNSLSILSGSPGIGKSTLLLQLIHNITKINNLKSIYFSAEEQVEQLKARYDRLKLDSNFAVANENNMIQIIKDCEDYDFIILDSINTMYIDGLGVIGGISQIKECTMQLMNFAKKQNKTIIIVGQISKDGALAGPKILEHMADSLFFFENFDGTTRYKILNSLKNRFGRTDESVIYEMGESGMQEIADPSLLFIEDDPDTFGTATSIFFKGNRPIFVEIESLVNDTESEKNIVQSTGVDQKKLFLLTAVIQKYLNIQTYKQNIFLNVVGGLNISKEKSSHVDLAIIASVMSSIKMTNLNDYIFIGEVSLSGKIRKAQREDEIIQYVKKMNLNKKIISYSTGFKRIEDLLKILN